MSHTEFVCKLLQQKTELFFEFVKFSNLFLRNFGRMWIVELIHKEVFHANVFSLTFLRRI